MDRASLDLAKDILSTVSGLPIDQRYLVGISGIPASGKSTFAEKLVRNINGLSGTPQPAHLAVLVGLDGWHLTRAELAGMPDPALAVARRGAHWTFDGQGYVRFVQRIRRDISSATSVITGPSFDHALKDPVCDSILVEPHHKIIVIEGLYTFLSISPWKEAGNLLNLRVLITVPEEQAQARLIRRHVQTGVAGSMDEALWRSQENDMPNGHFILANNLTPNIQIDSVEDASLSP